MNAGAAARRIAPALRALAAASCACLPLAAEAQIYGGTEPETGAVVLSNFRSDQAASLIDGTTEPAPAAAPPAGRAVAPTPAASTPAQYDALVAAAARKNALSPELIHAVIRAESRYDARAVSPKGAVGLMQLLPATGRRFGAQDLFSAQENVAAGAGYLRWLMGRFGGRLELVLAAYNAGEQAVLDAGCRIPDYPETQAYVKRILASLAPRGAIGAPGADAGRARCS
ncbi:MAG: lytic transglycosylase domain-containing protein [Burkholderiaceae bacterium]